MAITISERPRLYAYTEDSPAAQVYGTWCAAWNPIVYKFSVPTTADRNSSLLVQVYELGSNTLLSRDLIKPFREDDLVFDVAPSVRAYLFSEYETDFTAGINCEDAGNSITFYITYTQYLSDGTYLSLSSEQDKPVTAVCSAMQFGDSNGGNMIDYTPFNEELPEVNKMKFLSGFETPVKWAGYPFTLSFIYSRELAGVEVLRRQQQQNINRLELVTNDTLLDTSKIGKVNYLLVTEPTSALTRFIQIELRTGQTINDYYVDPGYVDDGYTQIQ